MLVQQPRTMTRKQPDPIFPIDRASLSDPNPSPTSPLERNPLSPKGWKNRDSGGVGLGIVAALGDAPAKVIVGVPNLHVSAPISMATPRTHGPKNRTGGLFCSSPAGLDDEGVPAFRTADFLDHCYLCSKRLHGKDIYMYRGEKAFCSMECRFRQIVSDEFQEKCGSVASKPSEVSSSPYSGGGRLFFTGIAAA